MATAPFSIKEHRNKSGTLSYKVTGTFNGERIRKNFRDSGKASAFCNEKNVAALAKQEQPQRAVVTSLSPADLAAAEAAVASGKWQLPAIIEAGLATLATGAHAHASDLVADAVKAFLADPSVQVGDAWRADLKKMLNTFVAAHPKLTLGGLTPAVVRAWLASDSIAPQTRRNRRGALSRFGGWLVETGRATTNPAASIRVQVPHNVKPPPVLTVYQAANLLTACAAEENAHTLGHVVLCLLCGLRPSEADRLAWGEIHLDRAELTVLGRKRGSKPRIIPLQPAAVAWLGTLDREKPPGLLYRKTLARALRDCAEAGQPIAWAPDILRHTYASMRAAAKIPLHELAAEMGNSPRVIYAHYRAAISPTEAEKFWALRPTA